MGLQPDGTIVKSGTGFGDVRREVERIKMEGWEAGGVLMQVS
jgi:hypothetical protein